MEKKSTLSGKLKAYSALAGAAAIAGGADAQVIYTDVNPDVTKSANGDTYMLDLNNDATVDFVLTNAFGTSSGLAIGLVTANITNQNAIAGTVQSSAYPFPFALNAGTTIDATTTPWNDTTLNGGLNYLSLAVGPPYNLTFGAWGSATDKILPLRIKIAGQDHYGWARLTVATTSSASTFTIKDYAYNATPATGITGGQIPTAIEENALTAVKVYAYANNITVDLGNEIKAEGNIVVTNVIGEQVFSQSISNSKTQFSLNAASGVYLVTINNGGNSITKKVYLQ